MSRDRDHGDSSDPIAEFYEHYPYPPPVDDLDEYQRRWRDPVRRRGEHALLFPGRRMRSELDVLVAGCGTFQAARHALRWPAGRVVGIDVSTTSIQHTQRLRDRYGLGNLELEQLSIERVSELDRRFDIIVCTGVLHHLADPDAGLRALRDVLRPGGAMLIMVYAPYGRTGITMMQDYARRLGLGRSDAELGAFVESLREIPRDHPLDSVLRSSPDFRRLDAVADALLNPRDRTYSVPELFEYIERNGLVFGRWYRQAPYLSRCGVLATIPHAERLAALDPVDQYAVAELFRGSMSRHSVVIHRNDYASGGQDLSLPGGWQGLVPIRIPGTLTIEERLPPDAAAILINPEHAYPDLILPVSAEGRRLVDAIDGSRTVAAIADATQLGRYSTEALLSDLYAYDQVVLAASDA